RSLQRYWWRKDWDGQKIHYSVPPTSHRIHSSPLPSLLPPSGWFLLFLMTPFLYLHLTSPDFELRQPPKQRCRSAHRPWSPQNPWSHRSMLPWSAAGHWCLSVERKGK